LTFLRSFPSSLAVTSSSCHSQYSLPEKEESFKNCSEVSYEIAKKKRLVEVQAQAAGNYRKLMRVKLPNLCFPKRTINLGDEEV
jgi:hypothetical protein